MTPIPEPVEAYLRQVESGTPRVCPEQTALAKYIRETFEREKLIFEAERFEKYVSLEKYFPFALFPWEKFLIALWLCTYKAPGLPRWKTLFCMVGRGAGKDGLIAFISFCRVSPYNTAAGYDVDICANDEEQAMRPVKDVIDVLEKPNLIQKLKRFLLRIVLLYGDSPFIQKGDFLLGQIKFHTVHFPFISFSAVFV